MRHKTTVFETHIKNCHALFFWHPPSSGTLYSIHHLQLKSGENKFTEKQPGQNELKHYRYCIPGELILYCIV